MYKNDKIALFIEVLNDTNDYLKYTDGKIIGIWQNDFNISNGANKIIFPGGIKVGDKITEEQIVSKYGKPIEKSRFLESITYKYSDDNDKILSNDFLIKVTNGVISEITLKKEY